MSGTDHYLAHLHHGQPNETCVDADRRAEAAERERDHLACRTDVIALKVSVLKAADREHARGCHYRHQQGETDECNSCTAARIEEALGDTDALAERDARIWDEALRWVRQWSDNTSPQEAIVRIDRAEPFNPYRRTETP